MTELIFRPEDVAPLVHHSMNAPEQGQAWGREPFAEPMLCLVKDEGIYLMSNGQPRQLDAKRGGECGLVAYAVGFDPRTVVDCWDRCAEAVGGDDFCEYLPAAGFTAALGVPGALIHVKVTATRITVRMSMPKPAGKERKVVHV